MFYLTKPEDYRIRGLRIVDYSSQRPYKHARSSYLTDCSFHTRIIEVFGSMQQQWNRQSCSVIYNSWYEKSVDFGTPFVEWWLLIKRFYWLHYRKTCEWIYDRSPLLIAYLTMQLNLDNFSIVYTDAHFSHDLLQLVLGGVSCLKCFKSWFIRIQFISQESKIEKN